MGAPFVRILGLCGSTRANSLNRSLLMAATKLLPDNSAITLHELDRLPLYCASKEQPFPAEAAALKEAIEASDAVIFATSEHNFSVTAALKNALDWASRPIGNNSWAKKTAAIMGASPSPVGTARAQYHLRQILVGLDMPTINLPEVLVSHARERLDEDGNVKDPQVEALVARLLATLVGAARLAMLAR